MKAVLLLACAVLLVLALSSAPVTAAWTVTYLTPTGTTGPAAAVGVSGGQQSGSVDTGAGPHACVWSGTPGSRVDLSPAGSTASWAQDTSGGQQVGYSKVGDNNHASLWSGTAASWVDLNPSGATSSEAYGVSNGIQVGNVNGHAAMWSGTAASWVDLNPVGSTISGAFGVSGGQQVGHARIDNIDHASLWSGSAASWVDLSPSGSFSSCAFDVSGAEQVGTAKYTPWHAASYIHAILWRGTAASAVDLNPTGITNNSWADSVSNGWQSGYVVLGGKAHASVWHGTAESWLDLHSLLGADYMSSGASSIEVTGSDIWIAGSAVNSVTGYEEAVLWHNAVPEPSGLATMACGIIGMAGLFRRKRAMRRADRILPAVRH